MAKKKSNTLKILVVNFIVMVVVAVAICFMTLAWLDSFTLHNKVIEVPSVAGKHIDEASSLLRNKKLDFEVVDYKYKKGARENEVVEMQPIAGSMVKEGRKIQLTLSSAKEPMQALPDIVDNCSLREAEARLRAAGFNLANNIRIKGESDWVYFVLMGSDTLENGAKVPMGATLTLLVGNGDEVVMEAEPVIEEAWFE